MKLSYIYTKNDFKKFLINSRKINNLILLFIGIVIYLWITINKLSLVYLPLAVLGLIIIIYIINKIYVVSYIKVQDMLNYNTYGKYIVELTPNKFSITVNNNKVNYKYKDIKSIKIRKNLFSLKLGIKNYLTFEKRMFNELDYIKLLDMFKEKCKIDK